MSRHRAPESGPDTPALDPDGDVQSAVFRQSGPDEWTTDTDLDDMVRAGQIVLYGGEG